MYVRAVVVGLCIASVPFWAGCDDCALEETEFEREACKAELAEQEREDSVNTVVRHVEDDGPPIDTQFFPDKNGMQFDLHGCARLDANGTETLCVLTIASLGFDWDTKIGVDQCTPGGVATHAVDMMGNSYTVDEVRVANDPLQGWCQDHEFLAETPTRTLLSFPNVHAGATAFVRLTMSLTADRGEGETAGEVVFRDVPIDP